MNDSWVLHPRLLVPGHRPCAVLCAVFDRDPVPAARELVARIHDLDASWNAGFRVVTGSDVFLLKDFEVERPVSGPDDAGGFTVTLTREFQALSSNSPDGPRWLATKSLAVGDERWCWCVPFEARRGAPVEVILDASNRLRLGVELAP